MLEVKMLGDVPHLAPIVALWTFEEWGKTLGRTYAEQLSIFEKRILMDKLPMCLVALLDGCPVGTASLVENDHLDDFEVYTPWISALFVAPGYRSKGIAATLLEKAGEISRHLGYKKIYLHTPNAKGYYFKHHWVEKENTTFKLGSTTVMYKEI